MISHSKAWRIEKSPECYTIQVKEVICLAFSTLRKYCGTTRGPTSEKLFCSRNQNKLRDRLKEVVPVQTLSFKVPVLRNKKIQRDFDPVIYHFKVLCMLIISLLRIIPSMLCQKICCELHKGFDPRPYARALLMLCRDGGTGGARGAIEHWHPHYLADLLTLF